MAIEVTPVAGSPKFPRAYRSKPEGFVVLFFSEESGAVLKTGGNSFWKVGDRNTSFVSCHDESHWEPVNLSITHD